MLLGVLLWRLDWIQVAERLRHIQPLWLALYLLLFPIGYVSRTLRVHGLLPDLELMKLELLRGLLTYFHYASKETRPDVFRSEIERINGAVQETQDRWRTRQLDEPTDVSLRWGNAENELGKHHSQRV